MTSQRRHGGGKAKSGSGEVHNENLPSFTHMILQVFAPLTAASFGAVNKGSFLDKPSYKGGPLSKGRGVDCGLPVEQAWVEMEILLPIVMARLATLVFFLPYLGYCLW